MKRLIPLILLLASLAHAATPADLAAQIKSQCDAYNASASPQVKPFSIPFADGTSVPVPVSVAPPPITPPLPLPTTAPVLPPGVKVIRVGPGEAFGSVDVVNLAGASNTVYLLVTKSSKLTKSQRINQPGVWIIGADQSVTLDADAAHWKQAQFTFGPKATGGGVRNFTIIGHDGGEFVDVEDTERITLADIIQKRHPVHHGGITPILCRSSKHLLLSNIKTEGVARYGFYLGGIENIAPTILDSEWGPCVLLEDRKLSGQSKDGSTLNGGGPSEHGGRAYNVTDMTMARCKFFNQNNSDGKQAFKLMSGDGARITDCSFFGSTRFGRDINDPPTYTLRNVVISRCVFGDWIRIDPGAKVVIDTATIKAHGSGNAINVMGDGHLVLTGPITAEYPGGKLSNASNKVDASAAQVKFNGN